MKEPRSIFPGIFAFPPNRKTLGGTAYWIHNSLGNILVDSPPWEEQALSFLQDQGGVRWLFLTHRTAMAQVKEWQQALGCEVVVQEQEAYLLPGVECRTFEEEITFNCPSHDGNCVGFWVCGYSPGSACFYWPEQGGILFSGRHLLPTAAGNPAPLRTSKTFHWVRQLRNVHKILDRYDSETLNHICPGASVGFLRGKGSIDRAYDRLSEYAFLNILTAT